MGREVGVGFKMWGMHVYLWPIHADVWQKPSQYCKVSILQLKLINFQKKKELSERIEENAKIEIKWQKKFRENKFSA